MRSGLLMMSLVTLPACQPLFVRQSTANVAPPTQSEFGTLAPGQRAVASTQPQPEPPTAVESRPVDTVTVAAPNTPPTPLTPPVTTQVTYTNPEMLFPEQANRGPRPDSPLVSAMHAHLDGRYAAAVGHLAGFERRNQELLLLLLPIVDVARTVDLTSGHDPKLPGLAHQLDTAKDLIARIAPLGLRTMTFVTSVRKYGVYDPLPPSHSFPPGGLAMLYVEVVNAPSIPAAKASSDTGFITKLAGTLELTDSNNRTVEQTDRESGRTMSVLPFTQDEFTRSPIRDHFIKVEFLVPEKPGKYRLRLEVKDADGGRRVAKAIEFFVRGT